MATGLRQTGAACSQANALRSAAGSRSFGFIFIRTRHLVRRDIIMNTGVSGQFSTDLPAHFDWRVLRFNPDVVSINLGMNDSARITVEQHKEEMGR
jgi:hypothetical protein